MEFREEHSSKFENLKAESSEDEPEDDIEPVKRDPKQFFYNTQRKDRIVKLRLVNNNIRTETHTISPLVTKKENEVNDLQSKIDINPETLNYLPLNGQCFEKKTNFDWKICFFKEVKQSQHYLGKYKTIEHETKTVVFDEGTACPGNVKRNSRVRKHFISHDIVNRLSLSAVSQTKF